MKPFLGFLLLTGLAYVISLPVGIAMAFLFASPVVQLLPFVAVGYILLGALLTSSGRQNAEDVYKRAYVTGGGTLGDVRVWPEAHSEPGEPTAEEEKLATPSGISSQEHIEKATPWLTSAFLGPSLIVAGVGVIALVYFLSFT